MENQLEEKLYRKYPKIFRQKDWPITQSCMGWGINTPNSWYSIIDNLCFCLQDHVDNGGKVYKKYPFGKFLARLFRNAKYYGRWVHKPIRQVEAVQVKEKYGTLRFYTNYYDPVIDQLVMMAELMTTRICSRCGSAQDIIETTGWISFTCSHCLQCKEKSND